jgi:hypothetical protein
VPGQESKTEIGAIRQLIDRRLKSRVTAEVLQDLLAEHLDEDAICAFVEGRLEETESAPVVSHLVACSFCRHTTAQLIRLESQFEDVSEPALDDGPGRLREFLENLAARVTPSFEEDAVFAYQNPETEPDPENDVAEERPEKPDEVR